MENQKKPDNYLVWAILCTILCCLPLGVVSIVYAAKVDGLYAAGDLDAAQEASDNAKKYAKYGAICGVVGVVIYFICMGLVGYFSVANQ